MASKPSTTEASRFLMHQPVLVTVAAAAVLPAALADVDERELARELGALEAELDVPSQPGTLEILGRTP